MASIRIVFRGTKAQAKRVARDVIRSILGKSDRFRDLAEGVFLSVGVAALSDVKDDFVRKARGEVGEDGVTWQPLSPATIARRRVGPRDERNDPQIRERQKLVRSAYKRLLRRYRVSMSEQEAVALAKRQAELEATRIMGQTKQEVLGSRGVEILRDTGVLLNSLTPGRLVGGSYLPPSDEGGEEQIMQTLPNGVDVGTNVPYAATHQYGDASRNIPARPFIPERPPRQWLRNWIEVAQIAMAEALRIALQRGPTQ